MYFTNKGDVLSKVASWSFLSAKPLSLTLIIGFGLVALGLWMGQSWIFAAEGQGPSAFCHVTDGVFTECPGEGDEWSDIIGTEFTDEDDNLVGVLFVDQADFDPLLAVSETVPEDTLVLMYTVPQQTTPLGPGSSVHIHFMTVDPPHGEHPESQLTHYDVFIGPSGINQLFINDELQDPMPTGVAGIAGFGTSPQSPDTPHVMAEFQIGLLAAGADPTECCYSPDPAWWGSSHQPIGSHETTLSEHDKQGLSHNTLVSDHDDPPTHTALLSGHEADSTHFAELSDHDSTNTHFDILSSASGTPTHLPELSDHEGALTHFSLLSDHDGVASHFTRLSQGGLSHLTALSDHPDPVHTDALSNHELSSTHFDPLSVHDADLSFGDPGTHVTGLSFHDIQVTHFDQLSDHEDQVSHFAALSEGGLSHSTLLSNHPADVSHDTALSTHDVFLSTNQNLNTAGFLKPNFDGTTSTDPTPLDEGEPPLLEQLVRIIDFQIIELGATADEAEQLLDELIQSQIDQGRLDPADAESLRAEVLDSLQKVAICHVPKRNSAKARTLSIKALSVSDHLAHGDSLGPCD